MFRLNIYYRAAPIHGCASLQHLLLANQLQTHGRKAYMFRLNIYRSAGSFGPRLADPGVNVPLEHPLPAVAIHSSGVLQHLFLIDQQWLRAAKRTCSA